MTYMSLQADLRRLSGLMVQTSEELQLRDMTDEARLGALLATAIDASLSETGITRFLSNDGHPACILIVMLLCFLCLVFILFQDQFAQLRLHLCVG